MTYLIKYGNEETSKLTTTKNKSIRGFYNPTITQMPCSYYQLNEFDQDLETYVLFHASLLY